MLLGIPFVNRPDLLKRAIGSLGVLLPRAVILDDSEEGLSPASWEVPIVRLPVRISFSQSMNLLQRLAIERSCGSAIYMHNDAEAAPETPARLIGVIAEAPASGRRWGVVFTNYDALAAYNVGMIREVGPWDVRLPDYFSDNDFYRRVRLAGYEMIETGLAVSHAGSSTIRSDPHLSFVNSVTYPLYERYYVAKWGGPPGQERFTEPFNRARAPGE